MVRWNNNGVRGFELTEAAQHFIDHVCMSVALEHDYRIEKEF